MGGGRNSLTFAASAGRKSACQLAGDDGSSPAVGGIGMVAAWRLGALLALALAWSVQAQESRFALVIGNGAYKVGPLRNPVNDARAMGRTLQALGFAVDLVENADRDRMRQAIRQFQARLAPDSVGLLYYSGHGIQAAGANYL